VLNYFTTDKSLLELLQEAAPAAHLVKAFNSIGSHLMVNPNFAEKPTMFICGNNDDAKKEVSEILDLFGFEVEDSGKANAGHAVEALCILWCIPGFAQNRWVQAFRLMK
jgi:predicted dinucleotide-binding enzyme